MRPIPVTLGLPVEEGGAVGGGTVRAAVLKVVEGRVARGVIVKPVQVDVLVHSAIYSV